DSAITFIHDVREKNGTRWDDVNPSYRLGQVRHSHFLDTLLIVDHERKHSLSPVHASTRTDPASRDMLIFFTRRPALPGHISHPYDSFNSHREMPLAVDYPTIIKEQIRVAAHA